MLTHRAEPSSLLYYWGQLVSKWEYCKRRKEWEEGEMNLLWLLWWTQLFNTAPFLCSSPLSRWILPTAHSFLLFLPLLSCVCTDYISPTGKLIHRMTDMKKVRSSKMVMERISKEMDRRKKWKRKLIEMGKKSKEMKKAPKGWKKKRLNRLIWFIYNEIRLSQYWGMCSI